MSALEISSDDVFALLLATPACPIVTLQLNYLDRLTRRFVIVNTSDHTIEADLAGAIIKVDRNTESFTIEQDQSYREMHAAILSGNADNFCSLADGLETLRLVEAAERAAVQNAWVER